ncbi:MAG: PIG-L deacetylase family protein [Bacteroidales bacterium]|jgi:LmbE family N-acetylglucosaminyl deacetylase|nr:PIG-L deacetylase family protein [Bacteroidales bacterium]
MKILKSLAFIILMLGVFSVAMGQKPSTQEKLHVIIIGAHPDDPDEVGGTAYKWAQMGHDVLMVSLTNGDAGHQSLDSETLAKVRREEARKAGEVIGVKYITLDNHDGQLMPTYENRLQVIKLIREHQADIVIFHRPYDYHPDHRYTGTLVLDAAYMVTVPKILPEVRHLDKNPVFLYTADDFVHPEPFIPDVCVAIDDVIEKKIDMYHQHTSQMYEWLPFNRGQLDQVPATEKERRAWLGETWSRRSNAEPYREILIEHYGSEKGSAVKYCEAFQDSGYGTRLTKENIKKYFPFY